MHPKMQKCSCYRWTT